LNASSDGKLGGSGPGVNDVLVSTGLSDVEAGLDRGAASSSLILFLVGEEDGGEEEEGGGRGGNEGRGERDTQPALSTLI